MILANQVELEKYKLIQKQLNDQRTKLADAEKSRPIIDECVKKSQTCNPVVASLIQSGINQLLGKHKVEDIYELEELIVEERKKVKQLTDDLIFVDKIFLFPIEKKEVEKKFTGVRWRDNKWISEIGLNGTRYFGGYDTQKEAAISNDQDRIHLFGPLYPREMLNFPENWEKYLNQKNKSERAEEWLEKNKGKFYPVPGFKKKENDCLNILSSLKGN
jgi:hypothetical protein